MIILKSGSKHGYVEAAAGCGSIRGMKALRRERRFYEG